MWSDPLEYVSYELVPTSPSVSRMSASSNLDNFRDGEVSDRTPAALGCAASRTCLILLAEIDMLLIRYFLSLNVLLELIVKTFGQLLFFRVYI